jgi:hypothetical protein
MTQRLLKLTILFCGTLFTFPQLHAQFLSYFDTIASYPLINNAADITGMQPDAELINVPYADTNGVYCNGIYVNSGDPNGSVVSTAHLDALYGPAFAVSVQFRFDSLAANTVPVIICGDSWRYFGLLIRYDGVVLYNFNNIWHEASGTYIADDTWHTFTGIYTALDSTAQYWLDGQLLATKTGTLIRSNQDGRVSNTDYGAGWTFQGYLRNLTIMASDDMLSGSSSPTSVHGIHSYPNPVSETLFVTLPADLSWTIHSIDGKLQSHGQLTEDQAIDVTALNSGFYILEAIEVSKKVRYSTKFGKH